MNNIKVVCFDLNGTMINNNIWETMTVKLGCSLEKHLEIYHKALKGEIPFPEAEKQLIEMYRASGKATRANLTQILLGNPIPDESVMICKYLKEKNYRLYLVSGSYDIAVKSISIKLGMYGYYAGATTTFDDTDTLLAINYIPDQRTEKMKYLGKIALENEISVDQIAFVGNGKSDFGAFEITSHGIYFDHGQKLTINPWKIIRSLVEIKEILQ